MSHDNLITAEILPWALPKEDITLFIKLQKNTDFSKIIINLPTSIEFRDSINVSSKNIINNIIEITKIGICDICPYDYFGLIITSTKPFDSLAVQKKISIELIESNAVSTKIFSYARIFRPKLTIKNIQEKIFLYSGEETTLPLELKLDGFGDISIRIESKLEGNLVSEGETSPFERMFHAALREGLLDGDINKTTKEGVTIHRESFLKDMEDIKLKLKDPKYFDQLKNDEKIKEETVEWLMTLTEVEQEKFMGIFYDNMEGYLIKKLTDMFSRNISRHIQIDSGTKIGAELTTRLTNLELTIYYRDLANNEYEPLTKKIVIEDQRSEDDKLRVIIPIKIKNDIEDVYHNVQSMVI